MKNLTVLAFVLLTHGVNVQAQNLSDGAIKTAITNALKSRPPWEMIAGGAIGIPANVRAQSITIVRRGPYNSQKRYWPIQATVSGTFDKKYHDGTAKQCTFAGTTDFQIYKNDYGDWLARVASSYAAETQLRPDCSGRAIPTQPQGGTPGDKQWQVFWTSFVKAVQNRNRVVLRTMMSNPFNSGGGGDYTPSRWISFIDKARLWQRMERAVALGTRPLPQNRSDSKRPSRVTNDDRAGSPVFEFGKDGRWRWTGVMGD